jgi:hypothetical protein
MFVYIKTTHSIGNIMYSLNSSIHHYNLDNLYPASAPPLENEIPPAIPPAYVPIYPHYPHLQSFDQASIVPTVPPRPNLTQTVHNDTKKLLAKAAEFSSAILGSSSSKQHSYSSQYQHQTVKPSVAKPAAPIFNIDLSDRHWDMFNSKTEVHHHYHNGERKNAEKTDNTGIRILVGVAGFTIALVAAFFVGKAVAQGEDVAEENIGFEKLKDRWKFNKACYEGDHQALVEEVISRTDTILQRRQINHTHKIALLVFAFISGGAGFAGALIGSTALMTAAVALGVIVSIAALFKLGYACFSMREKNDARAIEKNLAELQQKQLVIVC